MEEDINAEVHDDEDSQDETTEEEPDFSSEYEPETETDTGSESEENSSGNRYIIYQLPCIEHLCTCTTTCTCNSLQQSHNFKNLLQLRAILLLLTKMYIFYKNPQVTHKVTGLHESTVYSCPEINASIA